MKISNKRECLENRSHATEFKYKECHNVTAEIRLWNWKTQSQSGHFELTLRLLSGSQKDNDANTFANYLLD
jgi:hypothetical protein